MAKKTINVTKKDIELGQPGDCYECPIARAATRAFHKPMQAGFRICERNVDMFTANEFATAPKEAMVFINLFDNYVPVEPFKFQVEVEFI